MRTRLLAVDICENPGLKYSFSVQCTLHYMYSYCLPDRGRDIWLSSLSVLRRQATRAGKSVRWFSHVSATSRSVCGMPIPHRTVPVVNCLRCHRAAGPS